MGTLPPRGSHLLGAAASTWAGPQALRLSSLQVASLVLNLLLVLLAVALAFLAFKRTGGGSSMTLSLGKSANSRYEVGGRRSVCHSRRCASKE
jgi:hypothetical protein